MQIPNNWPKGYTYSPISCSADLSEEILATLLYSVEDKQNVLIKTARVHKHLCIKEVGLDHPLKSAFTISGEKNRGLFASEVIASDTFLGEYVGRLWIFSQEHEAMEKLSQIKPSEYRWLINHDAFHLVIDPTECMNELAFANDYRGISLLPNTAPSIITHDNRYYFGFTTLREIVKGEEILIDYGQSFWQAYQQIAS